MMTLKNGLVCALLVAGLVLVGCAKQEAAPAPETAAPVAADTAAPAVAADSTAAPVAADSAAAPVAAEKAPAKAEKAEKK